MKNTLIIILLCVFLIIGVTGCSKKEFEVGEKSNINIINKNVSITIKENTLTNTGATLIIKNNSDTTLYYADSYEIEIKQNGNWHKINAELSFNEPLWNLEKNKSNEIELNWESIYGKLAKGEYRLIKEVYFENKEENTLKFYISAEFNIK